MADTPTDSQVAPADTASTAATAAAAPTSQPAATATDTTAAAATTDANAQATTDAAAAQAAADAAAAAAAKDVVYEFKLPDGVKLEGESLEELKTLAKESGLTQEQAQKLADLGAKQAQSFANQIAEQQKAVTAEWETQARTDKEFGGDKLDENLGVAKKALDTFGSPGLKEMLVKTGLGNHPEVIRLLVKTGKAISEDGRIVTGSAAQTDRAATPVEDRLYGKQN